MNYQQRSFGGGMNNLKLDTELDASEYRLGVNVRTRYGWAEACNLSVDITYNLTGQIQGLYAVGAIWLAFSSGQAYYMIVGGTNWTRIPNLSLDPFTTYIYAAAVNASVNNYIRQAVVTGTVVDASAGIIKSSVSLFSVSGTPAGVVCQDGINQPWLITYDQLSNTATARRLGTYNDWSNTGTTANSREYVPIGKQMMYLGNVLYIVSQEGNIIYRSVSGRPLDFMINIDKDGNKLATELLGGAKTTSFAVDFDTINALVPSNTDADSFLICTGRFIYGMKPDFTNTIFGEPTFTKIFQVESGVVNQFCITEASGDTPFIDFEGVKFFNSVEQLRFEGANDPLTKEISKILRNIIQTTCAAKQFDNYNFFSLNTTYGFLFAVYDNMIKKWVSLDSIQASVGGILMFAEGVTPSKHYLACATKTNKIFALYSDTNNRETAWIQLRSFVVGEYVYGNFVQGSLFDEHKLNQIKVALTKNTLDGYVQCIEQVDEKIGQIGEQDFIGIASGVNYPVQTPVIANNKARLENITFPFNQGIMGHKIHPILKWNTDAKIERAEVSTTTKTSTLSQRRQQQALANAA